ncbi:MAG: peptidoglycan bridge formation glycyltransferase FemA/FemB family protein [Ktedonobacteraceae bacterium]|nr:peptidoglycan bridge formation glycyltransferase FemA/FemB family protein [Chloroflexota bacterium]
MSSRYMLRPVKDRKQWDGFVAEHPDGHILQSWGWGELKADASWHPLRLALWDTEQRCMVAAAQVLQRVAARVPRQVGHLAYIPKGPLLDWSQPAQRDALFAQLHPYLRWRGALALWMELPQVIGSEGSDHIVKQVEAMRFRPVHPIQPSRTIMLDLTPGEDALLAGMKEKWRYNVRLAAKRGVTVREAQTLDDVRAWYALMQTTSTRDEFGIHTLDYYLRAWLILAPRDQGRLLLAEYEGQLLAGIFVTFMPKQAIYLYGASSNEYRQYMPNHLLQWEAIRQARQRGATSYDFWGIPDTDDEDEAMAGVYRFKRGWGGEVVRFLGCYERVYRPLAMRVARRFLTR